MIRYIVVLVFLNSCNKKNPNGYADLIAKAEKIHIVYTSGEYRQTTLELSTELRNSFKDVFKAKDVKCGCESSGRLRFYSKDKLLLVADFSIDKVDSYNDKDCVFLSVFPSEFGCFRLNYSAGMFLSETYADLKRENVHNN